jgi:hypothetical protein
VFNFVKKIYSKSYGGTLYHSYRYYDYYAQRKFDLNQFLSKVPNCVKEEDSGLNLLSTLPKVQFLKLKKIIFKLSSFLGFPEKVSVKSYKKLAYNLKVKSQVGYQGYEVLYCQRRVYGSVTNLEDVSDVLIQKHKFLDNTEEQWFTHNDDLHFFKKGFYIELITVYNYKKLVFDLEKETLQRSLVERVKQEKKMDYIGGLA